MDLKITTLAGKDAGKVKLSEEIFGLEPREDILARVVRWQLAKKQQGTHQAKGRADIARTGAKMYKQKVRAAPATIRHALRSSAAVVRLMVLSFAAMNLTCRRRSARLASSTLCRPR